MRVHSNLACFRTLLLSILTVVMMCSDLYGTYSYCFYRTVHMGLNIVPIKYSSDIHTPKHNYDVISIVHVTV